MLRERLVSKHQAIRLIQQSNGRVFRVTFVKRTTGEVRDLVGRLGVTKGVTGEGLKFNPADKALMTVYDFNKKAFRMINLEQIKEVQFKKRLFKVKED